MNKKPTQSFGVSFVSIMLSLTSVSVFAKKEIKSSVPDLSFSTVNEVLANKICVVEKDLSKAPNAKNKSNCIDKSSFLIKPGIKNVLLTEEFSAMSEEEKEKELSEFSEKLMKKVKFGPKLDDVGHEVFTQDTEVFCRYFFRPQNGSSKKFRCYRTDENNQLMDENGVVVPEAKSVAELVIDGELEDAVLVDSQGRSITYEKTNKDGEVKLKVRKADILKVRYTDYIRNRENFGGTFGARLSWLLGFPTEHSYMTNKVTCFGCNKDPWPGISYKEAQQKPLSEVKNSFNYASIERKNEMKRIIKAKGTEIVPWKWSDVLDRHKTGTYSDEIKNEILIAAQFAALLQTVEHSGQQHVMLCDKSDLGKVTIANNDYKYCAQPVAAMHDIGGALGNRITIDPSTKNHPRSDYTGYVQAKMFINDKDVTDCTLLNTLRDKYAAGFPVITKQANEDFKKIISILDRDVVRELFVSTHFEMADQKLRSSVAKDKKTSDQNVISEATLDAWTDAFMAKVEIFRNRQCK